jgi:hypothetical protein
MIKILLNNKEVTGANRITFYDELLVIEGLILIEEGKTINPLDQTIYHTKIKFESGNKINIYKEPLYCCKIETVPGNDGMIFKYFFKKYIN